MNDDNKQPEEVMDCMEAINSLHEYIDGELAEGDVARVEQHLNSCRSCFSRTEFEKELNRKMLDSGKDKMPKHLKDKINKLIDAF